MDNHQYLLDKDFKRLKSKTFKAIKRIRSARATTLDEAKQRAKKEFDYLANLSWKVNIKNYRPT